MKHGVSVLTNTEFKEKEMSEIPPQPTSLWVNALYPLTSSHLASFPPP